jgi:chemotaxis protein MotB
MAMKKKEAAPEPAGESAPMWIVSFADLVTLMMSFFVVLYALKQGGEKQQLETAAAIRAVFDGNVPAIDSPSEFDQLIRRYKGLPGPAYQNNGGHAPKPTDGASGLDMSVTTIREGKQIVTGTRITFDFNSVTVDASGLDAIKQIADKVRGQTNILFVKGHVAADEIAVRPDDPEGMSLSYLRANQVIEEFVKAGMDKKVLRPLPCGAYEPIRTGGSDTAAQKINRRVEVYATENIARDFAPMNTVPATEARGGRGERAPGGGAAAGGSLAHAADDKGAVEHP